MNNADIEMLRANFKYLRKTNDFCVHQLIHGYVSALFSHDVINLVLYLRLLAIADDYLV